MSRMAKRRIVLHIQYFDHIIILLVAACAPVSLCMSCAEPLNRGDDEEKKNGLDSIFIIYRCRGNWLIGENAFRSADIRRGGFRQA